MRFNNINWKLPVQPVPNDEIWYTSSDGNIVTPNDTTALPTIVSNTYVDGKGVIKFESDLTSIRDDAFNGCRSMTSVSIPSSVTSIGSRAFSNTGLASVYISNMSAWCAIIFSASSNPLGVAHNLYLDLMLVTNLVFPDSVTNIGSRAFTGCTSLTSVTISNNVETIGEFAFSGCSCLTSITIPNSVTSIGKAAFSECSGLTSIVVENENTVYDSRNNCNAIIKTANNELVNGCKNTIIPNSVTSIGERAFYGCSGLTSITIPNSVTSIGSVAFSSCNNLKTVSINSNDILSATYSTTSNMSTKFGSLVETYNISSNITSIGQYAFGSTSAKLSFTKLYSTYTNKIYSTPSSNVTYTYNVEFNISEIPTGYNISSMLPQHTGNKGTITYNIYTDYEACKDQALALANTKTIVNVYHIDGTSWA